MAESGDSEIALIAEQDQEDRGEYLKAPTPENWNGVTERDKVRRARVVELMNELKINTAGDYFNAGLVMIHGDTIEDLILCHVFAMAALAKGHHAAAWLSGISFDGVMRCLDQARVFDTNDKEVQKTVFITESIKKLFAPPPNNEDSE
jgi:hypothetical protein